MGQITGDYGAGTGMAVKALRKIRAYLSLALPQIWRRSGLGPALRARARRRSFDLEQLPEPQLLGRREEMLRIRPHPIACEASPLAEGYCQFLSRFQDQPTPRVSGVMPLRKARLAYPSGVVAGQSASGRAGLLADAYPSPSMLDNPKYAVPQATLGLRIPRSHHAQGYLLYTCWAHNFYHWTMDILPRLGWYEDLPELRDMPLVMWDSAPGFVRASLALAAPDAQVLWLPKGVHSFERLAVPTNFSNPTTLSARSVDYLRERYLPALRRALPDDFAASERLYVSRADAGIRRIANEPELEARLAEHGFRKVVMSDHSLAAQAELFARAKWIVAPHGAALVNLSFCKPDAKVVEIFQEGHESRSFYAIAGLVGLDYGFAVGRAQGADTLVDVDALLALMGRMGL